MIYREFYVCVNGVLRIEFVVRKEKNYSLRRITFWYQGLNTVTFYNNSPVQFLDTVWKMVIIIYYNLLVSKDFFTSRIESLWQIFYRQLHQKSREL